MRADAHIGPYEGLRNRTPNYNLKLNKLYNANPWVL